MMLNVPLQEVLQLIVSGAISVAREGKCGQLHPVAIQNIPIATNPLPNQGSTCRTRQCKVCRYYFRKTSLPSTHPSLDEGRAVTHCVLKRSMLSQAWRSGLDGCSDLYSTSN